MILHANPARPGASPGKRYGKVKNEARTWRSKEGKLPKGKLPYIGTESIGYCKMQPPFAHQHQCGNQDEHSRSHSKIQVGTASSIVVEKAARSDYNKAD